MFKRLRWMTLGGILGLVSSWWAQRKAKGLADRYAPVRNTASFAGSVRNVGRDLRSAWADGKREMRATEQQLRNEHSAMR